MQTATKLKSSQTKPIDKSEREMSESARNRVELDARLDRLSASRINLSIAAEKSTSKLPKPQ